MQIPAAMFIESAVDSVKAITDFQRRAQLSELHEVGDQALKGMGASGINDDVAAGYLLGLQTARVMIMTNAKIQLAGLVPGDIL
jgi:hypothetical protein